MSKKTNNRLYEFAKMITKSEATNEQITKELSSMTATEWSEQCEILHSFLMKYNISFDQRWEYSYIDFCNIAAANDVDEATLFVAYMKWLHIQE